jgi:succinoglycan biosynthesis protein ExoA
MVTPVSETVSFSSPHSKRVVSTLDRDVPFITIVIPARDEGRFIESTIRQLMDQGYDPEQFEVIVADGRSTDATCEIVRGLQAEYANLHLYENPRRLSSGARNIGIRHARGELIVIVDGHCELNNRDYLRDLADAFSRSGADCLGRPQPLDVDGASPIQRAIAAARSSRLGHHPDSHIYSTLEQFVRPQSVAVAYRRSVFDAVGLFDETFDACEDVEFNHRVDRAGLTCFFTPKVGVHYHPRSDLRGLFRQMVRYGRGRVRLLRKHPETFSLKSMMPGLFVLGLVSGAVLAPFSAILAAVYLAVLGLYITVVGAASLAIAVRPGQLRLLPGLFPAFVAIHVGAGTGLLTELVGGLRSNPKQRPTMAITPEPEPYAHR